MVDLNVLPVDHDLKSR